LFIFEKQIEKCKAVESPSNLTRPEKNPENQRCLSDFCIVVYDVEIKPFRDFDRKSCWISLDSFDFNGFYYWKE